MVKRTKNKSIKLKQKKNNVFRFSAISIFVILSFFSLPTISNFIDKNLNFEKSVISNAGVNFDQELDKIRIDRKELFRILANNINTQK